METRKHLPSLTSCRFFAALIVAIHHSAPFWTGLPVITTLSSIGWLGVPFFFILSGFVIAWTHQPDTSARLFWSRRIARIYPLHIFCLIISLLSYLILNIALGGNVSSKFGIFANALLIQDWFFQTPSIRQGWNGVAWSLSCEAFFYAVTPFFLPLLKAWSLKLFGLLLVAWWVGLFLLALIPSDWVQNYLNFAPTAWLFEYFVGIFGAFCLRANVFSFSLYSLFILSTLFVWGFSTFYSLSAAHAAILVLMFVPGCFGLIYSLAQADLRASIQNKSSRIFKLLHFLGEASFSLYMTHALLLGLLFYYLVHTSVSFMQSVWLRLLVGISYCICAIAISTITYQTVELPSKNFVTRLLLQKRIPENSPQPDPMA